MADDLPRGIRRCPRNKAIFVVRFMKNDYHYHSREAAVEAQLCGKRRLLAMKLGQLPVPPEVEDLRRWLISDGKLGKRQIVHPGQEGYEISINRFLDHLGKRVEEEEFLRRILRELRDTVGAFQGVLQAGEARRDDHPRGSFRGKFTAPSRFGFRPTQQRRGRKDSAGSLIPSRTRSTRSSR